MNGSDFFYDFEFLEGAQDKTFLGIKYGKTLPTIQMISVGMVDDAGREYYAISKDFNLKEAWNRYDEKIEVMSGDMRSKFPEGRKSKVYWIRENVLLPIWKEINDMPKKFSYDVMKDLISRYGKSNKQIAKEIETFIGSPKTIGNWNEVSHKFPVSLYGYYSAYDHVCLMQLFGKMIDKPESLPMYTHDLKQALDEKIQIINDNRVDKTSPLVTHKSMEENNPLYPKETNAHNALSDAIFNRDLHKFIQTLNETT